MGTTSGQTGGAKVVLPHGYDEAAAAADRRALSALGARDVSRRVKRGLRARVGDETAIASRLVLWERSHREPARAEHVLEAAHADATALAAEYLDVCAYVWGADHPDVLANADSIARGDVMPWEARRVIDAERRRADEFRRRSAEIAGANSARGSSTARTVDAAAQVAS